MILPLIKTMSRLFKLTKYFSTPKFTTKVFAVSGTLVGGYVITKSIIPKYCEIKFHSNITSDDTKDIISVNTQYNPLSNKALKEHCRDNNTEEIITYLNYLIDTNRKIDYGNTLGQIYDIACEYGRPDIIKILVTKYYFEPRESGIRIAVTNNNHHTVAYLLSTMIPSKDMMNTIIKSTTKCSYDTGNIILNIVLKHYKDTLYVVNNLIDLLTKEEELCGIFEQLANNGAFDETMWDSTFKHAAKHGNFKLFKFIVSKQLSNNYDDMGQAFIWACLGNNVEMVKYIINNYDSKVQLGYQVGFRTACQYGNYEVMEYLCEHHGGIKYEDEFRWTSTDIDLVKQLKIKKLLNNIKKK